MDREALRAAIHGVEKSRTWLSDWTELNWTELYNIVVVFAIHWHESALGVHVFPILTPPPTSFPIPSLRIIRRHRPWAPCLMHWRSVLYMVIYMFKYYSSKSSYPRLLPQSPKVCSLSLSLFLYRLLGHCDHLSKFHMYALIYCIGVFLSDLLHSV